MDPEDVALERMRAFLTSVPRFFFSWKGISEYTDRLSPCSFEPLMAEESHFRIW